MPVRLNGSTSGFVELAAPAVAGSTSLELPTDSIKPGLVLVAAQSFTGVSSVSVNNCFTATYENYRIVFQGTTPSANNYLGFRLRVSGSDNSTSNYRHAIGALNWAGSLANQTAGTAQSFSRLALFSGAGFTMALGMDVINPQRTDYTVLTGTNTNDGQVAFCGAWFNGTTSFDGFTVYSEAASTISGTLRIYGYRNSL